MFDGVLAGPLLGFVRVNELSFLNSQEVVLVVLCRVSGCFSDGFSAASLA